MFEKLLSIMPYNPGIIHQMSFYGRRMHEEAAIRRIGVIFLVLTFFVQFFAVLSPPKPTVADSTSNLLSTGFSTASEARKNCLDDTRDYQKILRHYGIDCDAVGNGKDKTIEATGENNQYLSVQHNPTNSAGETPVNIEGAGKLYIRHLSDKQKGSVKTLEVKNNQNKTFYLSYHCGDIVSEGVPPPSPIPEPTPEPTPTPSAPTPKCQYDHSLPADSPRCYQPCEYNGSIPASSSDCKPCDKAISSQDLLACVVVRKTASNQTQAIGNANNTTAKAGDVILYTLYAENKGKSDIKDFVFQENLSDVLDYADATDLSGGSIDAYKLVVWPAVKIKAGETASKQITVKVKDPVPQTPVSSTDSKHFDLKMLNVYGNDITINLPSSPAKSVEKAATTLPNTGPGSSLMIAASVVVVAGYFFGRARLLARESQLAIKEMAN